MDGDETELGLSGSYVFELGGRRARREEAAARGVDVAEAERADLRVQLAEIEHARARAVAETRMRATADFSK